MKVEIMNLQRSSIMETFFHYYKENIIHATENRCSKLFLKHCGVKIVLGKKTSNQNYF